MKVAAVLIGMSLSAVAGAQVRSNPQQLAAPSQSVAGNLRVEDAQVSLLKKQVAEIKQQLDQLKEKNTELTYCVGYLKREIDALKHPQPAKDDDGVTIQPPQGIGVTGCD